MNTIVLMIIIIFFIFDIIVIIGIIIIIVSCYYYNDIGNIIPLYVNFLSISPSISFSSFLSLYFSRHL